MSLELASIPLLSLRPPAWTLDQDPARELGGCSRSSSLDGIGLGHLTARPPPYQCLEQRDEVGFLTET